jgi:hypothetical protein
LKAIYIYNIYMSDIYIHIRYVNNSNNLIILVIIMINNNDKETTLPTFFKRMFQMFLVFWEVPLLQIQVYLLLSGVIP